MTENAQEEKVQLKPATRLVAPTGTYLISCGGHGPHRANIITVSAATLTCIHPPMIGTAIAPQRFSYPLIVEIGEFVLNVPDVALLAAVDQCGALSGRDVDKFAAAGLTPAPSVAVKPPRIAECPVNLECRVRHRIELGSHDWFIAEIVAASVRRDLLSEGGGFAASQLQPIVTVFGQYCGIGDPLAPHGFVQRAKQG